MHMYANKKMIPIEAIPVWGRGDGGEWRKE
jgi:hypothetical protein